jgi:hypothetical protein
MPPPRDGIPPPRDDVPPRPPAVLLLRDDPPCPRELVLLDLREPARALDLRPPRALVLREPPPEDLREPLLLVAPRPLLFRDPPLVLLRFVALAIQASFCEPRLAVRRTESKFAARGRVVPHRVCARVRSSAPPRAHLR